MMRMVTALAVVLLCGAFARSESIELKAASVNGTTVTASGTFQATATLKIVLEKKVNGGWETVVTATHMIPAFTWNATWRNVPPGTYEIRAVLDTGTGTVASKETKTVTVTGGNNFDPPIGTLDDPPPPPPPLP